MLDKFTSEISPCYENNMKSYTKVTKGRRFESYRGQAYFSSLPGVDIHSE
jgi:hypothetical protein